MERPDFGMIGLGRFGRFAADHLARCGSVAGHDPQVPGSLPLEVAARGRTVILAVPIRTMPQVLSDLAPLLVPGSLVADTASVKVWPARWLLQLLPDTVDLLATHPLFGPDSAASGLARARIAVCPLRTRHTRSIRRFLRGLGLEVIETTPEAHDRDMAETQALTHWLGRALEHCGAAPHAMETEGYRRLLEILGHVCRDSEELFLDMERWNPYAASARQKLLSALQELEARIGPPTESSE